MNSKKLLYIGELAKQAQVTVDTIRYYEKIGLLPKPKRLVSRYRVYESKTIDRITFIKQAQELGLSLAEIVELLSFQKNDRTTCLKMQNLLSSKIRNIDERIIALQDFRQVLTTHLAECNSVLAEQTNPACPVLEEIPHTITRTKKSLDSGVKTKV
ncbi:MAG: heavy metal-responsive transcriptional regulator [Blastocatellia bacterium]